MEVVASLEAVAHKRVTATTTGCAVINHRAAGGQLTVHQVVPRLLRVVVAESNLRAIAKVGEPLGDVVGIGSRRRRAILHLDRTTHIEHQAGHSIGVDLVFGTGVGVAHVFPVKRGHGQRVHRLGGVVVVAVAIGEAIRRYLGKRLSRLLVEVHNLRHGGGHTARVGQLIAVLLVVRNHELWTLVPIGSCLVPLAGDERSDGVARVDRCCATRGGQTAGGIGIGQCGQLLELLSVAVQHPLHVARHTGGIEVPLGRVAQHGHGAVIARDNDKTIVLTHIEHIVVAQVGHYLHGGSLGSHTQRARSTLLLQHKLCSLPLSLFTSDRSCPSHNNKYQHRADNQ